MVIWSQEGFMLLRLFLAALLVLCMEASQVETALLGQVSAHGTPIAGAIITISNRTFLKSVTTDDEGRFMLQPVPPGRYTLRTSAHGYAVSEQIVVVRPDNPHETLVAVKDLILADQQSISLFDLGRRRV